MSEDAGGEDILGVKAKAMARCGCEPRCTPRAAVTKHWGPGSFPGTHVQAAPIPNKRRPIVELVIEDLEVRAIAGEKKYGVKLQAHNGRSAQIDAYQESLDQTLYLRQGIEEERTPSGRRSAELKLLEAAKKHDPECGYDACDICPALTEFELWNDIDEDFKKERGS